MIEVARICQVKAIHLYECILKWCYYDDLCLNESSLSDVLNGYRIICYTNIGAVNMFLPD